MVVAGVWRWGAESAADTVSGAVGGCENKPVQTRGRQREQERNGGEGGKEKNQGEYCIHTREK